jgi:plastocyanin domain-containing protein
LEAKMRSFRYAWTVLAFFFLFSMSVATAAEKKEFTAKTDPDGVQRVEILAGSYFFDPNTIIVKVNVPVELKIRREPGMIPHNIVLKAPDAGIDIRQELKETPEIIKFTPTKTGTYPFDCDKKVLFFESHKDKGMTGTLEVRD